MIAAKYDALMGSNPFTPVFGKVPPYFAGREQIIGNLLAAFAQPQNSPDRCSIFVGARGTGKTALLTYFAHEAESRGWVSANVTASPTMLQGILERARESSAHLVEKPRERKLTGVSIAPVGGISWENAPAEGSSWRSKMNDLLDRLQERGTGLLITVDEVDPSLPEMAQLVTTYQHFVREDRDVILLMAGLPHRISRLLSGGSTSFLSRAARHNLGPIPRYEVEEAFRLTVMNGGRDIEQDALAYAADAIDGFPFMFQLVGYRSWNADADARVLRLEHVEQGVRLAQEELRDRVFDATLAELSPADVAFLAAMAQDDDATRQSDLKTRINRSSSHVSAYKKRLLEAGVIEEPYRGTLTFALPGFRDFIREEAKR